jgi:hypothetical protein
LPRISGEKYLGEPTRWLNRDPIEERDGINIYSYVRNKAVSFLDLKGLRVDYDNLLGGRKCKPIHDGVGDDAFGRLLTRKTTCGYKDLACKTWMATQAKFDQGMGFVYGPMHCRDQLINCLAGLPENWDSNWIRMLFGCDSKGSWAGAPPKLPEPDVVPPPDFNPETPWDGGLGDRRPY